MIESKKKTPSMMSAAAHKYLCPISVHSSGPLIRLSESESGTSYICTNMYVSLSAKFESPETARSRARGPFAFPACTDPTPNCLFSGKKTIREPRSRDAVAVAGAQAAPT